MIDPGGPQELQQASDDVDSAPDGMVKTGSTEPIVNIAGTLVALGPLRRDLLPLYLRWINDFTAGRNLGHVRAYTAEQETAWYDDFVKTDRDTMFTIYEHHSGRPIGTAGLHRVDHRNRTAEFGIIVGEASARGRGYGTETARLVLDYAFLGLGLHSVYLRVFEFNKAGQRAYTKAGYREFGRRRQCQFMGGRLWDVIYMECLATEFSSPVLEKLLAPELDSTEGGTEART